MDELRDVDKRRFPLVNVDGVVELFKDQLEKATEPNLAFLSIVLGMVEHSLTVNRPLDRRPRGRPKVPFLPSSDEQVDVPNYEASLIPMLELFQVETLYEQFVTLIKGSIDLTRYKTSKFTSPELLKKVSDVVWDALTRTFYKDKAHLQSLYTLLIENKMDCFGMAIGVIAGCQILGLRDVHLALSEDHAWAVFGYNGSQNAEITWHGKGTEDRRGQPVTNNTPEKSWLYLSPITCNRYIEVASLVVGINPVINATSESLEMAEIQKRVLWLLYDKGHLDKYPMGLGVLADMEEVRPTPNRPSSLTLYQKAIESAKKYHGDLHIYPYTYLGNYYYRETKYKEALSNWAAAAAVVSKYNYNREDDEIYREFHEIANDILPNVARSCSLEQQDSANARCVDNSFLRDPECYANLLRFYDGICEWEEGSSMPVLHIVWANNMTFVISKFFLEARLNVGICSAQSNNVGSENFDLDVKKKPDRKHDSENVKPESGRSASAKIGKEKRASDADAAKLKRGRPAKKISEVSDSNLEPSDVASTVPVPPPTDGTNVVSIVEKESQLEKENQKSDGALVGRGELAREALSSDGDLMLDRMSEKQCVSTEQLSFDLVQAPRSTEVSDPARDPTDTSMHQSVAGPSSDASGQKPAAMIANDPVDLSIPEQATMNGSTKSTEQQQSQQTAEIGSRDVDMVEPMDVAGTTLESGGPSDLSNRELTDVTMQESIEVSNSQPAVVAPQGGQGTSQEEPSNSTNAGAAGAQEGVVSSQAAAQVLDTTVITQDSPAPVSGFQEPTAPKTTHEPVTTHEPDAPVTTHEPDAPVTTRGPDAPVTTRELAAPVTTHEPAAPVTTNEPAALVTTNEPAAPVTTNEPAAPVATDEPAAPVTTDEPAAPVTTDEPAAPVTTDEPAAPVTSNEPAAPVTTNEPAAPVTTNEPAAPVTTNEPAAPLTTNEPAAPVTTNELAAPVTSCEPTDAVATQEPMDTVNTPDMVTTQEPPVATVTTQEPTDMETTREPPAVTLTTHEPTDVVNTVATDEPAAPVTTDEPAAPVTTDEPAAPVTTNEPAAPVTTNEPAAPVTTNEPAAPVTNNEPAVPVTTNEPAAPVTTNEPAAPVTANEPAAPVTSCEPTDAVATQEPMDTVNTPDMVTTQKPPVATVTTQEPTDMETTREPPAVTLTTREPTDVVNTVVQVQEPTATQISQNPTPEVMRHEQGEEDAAAQVPTAGAAQEKQGKEAEPEQVERDKENTCAVQELAVEDLQQERAKEDTSTVIGLTTEAMEVETSVEFTRATISAAPESAMEVDQKRDEETGIGDQADDTKQHQLVSTKRKLPDETCRDVGSKSEDSCVATNVIRSAESSCLKLFLHSEKMTAMKDLLVSKKLNTSAIKLQLTAQSQVIPKPSRSSLENLNTPPIGPARKRARCD